MALLALSVLASPATARTCVSAEQAVSEAFARYPAAREAGPWRRPDVRAGQAHLYRTVLREGTQGTPNFAGHSSLVTIGCGAGTACLAVVDRRSGRVAFPAAIRSVSAYDLEQYAGTVDPLMFRRDSRMLAVLGTPNEEERLAGLWLYEWKGTRPILVRHVRWAQLCRRAKAS